LAARFVLGGRNMIKIIEPELNLGKKCEKILRNLPEWFGIEEAINNYAHEINSLPTLIVKENDETIGFLSIKQHFPASAEIYVMALKQEYHRKGIGEKLLRTTFRYLKQHGVSFLQVKTLSPSRECKEYEKTRKFYLKLGFLPLEEFKELWGKENPCLLLVKSL
jgi:ribosomal protein S18 acetylase RimI-like enzyme